MGISYLVVIRSIKVDNLEKVDTNPFPETDDYDDDEAYRQEEDYLNNAKSNCREKFNEICIDGEGGRGLAIINYPICSDADVISFNSCACDEYGKSGFIVIFTFSNGKHEKKYVHINSTSFSRVMVKIPTIEGEKPSKLSYHIGANLNNVYDLENYKGEKKTLPNEGYYRQFRVSEYDDFDNFLSIINKLTTLELE